MRTCVPIAVPAPSLTKTLLLSGALAAAVLGVSKAEAGNGHGRGHYKDIEYAKVVDVEPRIRLIESEVPVRDCRETTVWRERPVHSPHYSAPQPSRAGVVGGTIVGGVIGGVIGDRFGGGEGRDAMRLFGTLVGATLGHEAATRRAAGYQYAASAPHYESEPYPVTECMTRYERTTREVTDGYRVTYRYRGREYVTITDEPPGSRIPVDVDVRPAW